MIERVAEQSISPIIPQSCSCCGKTADPDLIIKYCVCQNQFVNSCVSISSSETRLINSKKSLSWTCPNCHQVGNNINALKAAILSLQEEMRLVKTRVKSDTNEDYNMFVEIISKVCERQKRKRNILIFNVKEEHRQ